MKKVEIGNVVLLVVILAFVVFPLAGAAEALLLVQSEVPDSVRLWISGICVLLAVPLIVVVLYGLRRLRR